MKKEASIELRNGRRDIEDSEITIIKDLEWDDENNKWVIRINIKFSYELKKRELYNTNWYILIDDKYPRGEISIYPDRQDGIIYTYPHQSYNSNNENKKWTNGKICIDTQNKIINRMLNSSEPSNAYERLKWHCRRLKKWIILASEDKLLQEGDYFELPVFPFDEDKIVVFDENKNTLKRWKFFYGSYGSVKIYKRENMYIAREFMKKNDSLLYRINWGDIFIDNKEEYGIWILIKKMPLRKEWSVIEDWGELKNVLKINNIELSDVLLRYSEKLRDGKNHILMIGFPIPYKVGSEDVEVHWQGIKIPILTYKDKEIKFKGFMNKDKKYLLNDFLYNINENRKIDWIKSENWNEENFYSRGMLSRKLVKSKIMLIGCGSLGSSIAEYLVRGGVQNITLVDKEVFSSGNLVRHTLGIDSLNKAKVYELKNRLILDNPKLKVNTFARKFEKILLEKEHDIIIDCTANNNILSEFENVSISGTEIYFNISFSKDAKILFLYGCPLKSFFESKFILNLDGYNEKYKHEYVELPREGVGCWHPVFPAKMYEVSLMASIAINYIETFINQEELSEDFTAYETIYKNKQLIGVEKISYEE